ncbi:P-loop NTPase fold protein [Brachyspira pilosicoli]|uniref:P-loop NTPase fold protein n=1 Tax=Brachyspira pilosicoli TaxID=52584 RepID=UPI000E168E7A|nr:P-loop NTPase fold protein [Brachyspira pilosicoli]SUW04492.1 putative KAP NTPase P-loop domain-containing protein [Brachyspira pilosicoli]
MSDNDNYFKDIENTIKNYLAEENTDYGIMLTGEWGAGKTYYVKNYLGFIKEELQLNEPLYVSVLGKNSIDEIVNDIYLSELFSIDNVNNINFIKTIAKSGGKTLFDILKMLKVDNTDNVSNVIGSITNITMEMSKKIINFENRLIIIDEIERLPNNIEVDNLLYIIYDIFISNNIKVLFVCNEEEIYKKSENYKNIKEKVIRYTIKLHGSNSNNFIEFIKMIENNFIKSDNINDYFIYKRFFTDKLIPNICNIFVRMKCYNIRTFFKFINMSKSFLSEINKEIEGENYKLNYNEELFLYILEMFSIVVIAHDKGILDKSIFTNKETFNNYQNNDDITFGIIGRSLKEKDKYLSNNLESVKASKNSNDFFKMILNLKFFVGIDIIFYFYKYLECGVLDFKQIYLIYKPYIYFDNEYQNAFNVVIKCNCEYNEFIRNFNFIFNKMQSSPEKFEFKSYFDIYHLIFIIYKDIIDNDIKEKYLTICKPNLKKCLENENFDNIISLDRNLKNNKIYGYKINENDDFVVYLKELIEKFTSKDDSTILEVNKDIINNLLEHINNKDEDYFKYDILNRNEKKYLIFTKVVLNKIPKTINTVYIFSCIIFDIYILDYYYNYYREYYNSIKDMINNLIPFIDSIQTEDKCFQYQITELRNKIEEYNKSNI